MWGALTVIHTCYEGCEICKEHKMTLEDLKKIAEAEMVDFGSSYIVADNVESFYKLITLS
jgi:hypothetical protein